MSYVLFAIGFTYIILLVVFNIRLPKNKNKKLKLYSEEHITKCNFEDIKTTSNNINLYKYRLNVINKDIDRLRSSLKLKKNVNNIQETIKNISLLTDESNNIEQYLNININNLLKYGLPEEIKYPKGDPIFYYTLFIEMNKYYKEHHWFLGKEFFKYKIKNKSDYEYMVQYDFNICCMYAIQKYSRLLDKSTSDFRESLEYIRGYKITKPINYDNNFCLLCPIKWNGNTTCIDKTNLYNKQLNYVWILRDIVMSGKDGERIDKKRNRNELEVENIVDKIMNLNIKENVNFI